MSTLEVNTIAPQSGTTLTLGGSGDSIKAPTGAVWTGTVAQSSSSSIVENGSNSNGKFTKFADGTMICLMNNTLSTPAVTIDIGNGGQVRSANQTQTLPAAFTDTSYQVSFSVGRLFMAGLSSNSEPSSASQIGYHLRGWSSATGDENVKVSIMAIGRWY
jgi:hypothetical protein